MSKVQLIRIPLRLGEDAFTMGVISAEKEKANPPDESLQTVDEDI